MMNCECENALPLGRRGFLGEIEEAPKQSAEMPQQKHLACLQCPISKSLLSFPTINSLVRNRAIYCPFCLDNLDNLS